MSAGEGKRIPGLADTPIKVRVSDIERDPVDGSAIQDSRVFAFVGGPRIYRFANNSYAVGYTQLGAYESIDENGVADLGPVVDGDTIRIVENEDGSTDVENPGGDVVDDSWAIAPGSQARPSERDYSSNRMPDPIDPLAADGNMTTLLYAVKLKDADGDVWVGHGKLPLAYAIDRLSGLSDSLGVILQDRLANPGPGLRYTYALNTERANFAYDENTLNEGTSVYGQTWAWQHFSPNRPPEFRFEVTGTFRHPGLRSNAGYPTVDSFGRDDTREDALLKRGVVHIEVPDEAVVPTVDSGSSDELSGVGTRVANVQAVPGPRRHPVSETVGDTGVSAKRLAYLRAVHYTLRAVPDLIRDRPNTFMPIHPLFPNLFVSAGELDGTVSGGPVVSSTAESIAGSLAGIASTGLSTRQVGRYAGVLGEGLGKASSLLTVKSLAETVAGVLDDDSQTFTNRHADGGLFDPNEADRFVASWDLEHKSPAVSVSVPVDIGRNRVVTVRGTFEKPGDPAVDNHPRFLDLFQEDYTLKPKRVPARSGGADS